MFGKKEKIKFNKYLDFWINEKAFIAGCGLVSVLTLTGIYLSTTFPVKLNAKYTPLLSSLFIGTILGHHLGTATEKEGKTSSSFWLGASLTLAIVALAFLQLTLLSAILVSTAVTVFLIHNSGLVVQNKPVDKAVEISAFTSKLGLVTIGLYHYVMPLASDLINFLLYDLEMIYIVYSIL